MVLRTGKLVSLAHLQHHSRSNFNPCAVLEAHARDELGIDPDDLANPLQVTHLQSRGSNSPCDDIQTQRSHPA